MTPITHTHNSDRVAGSYPPWRWPIIAPMRITVPTEIKKKKEKKEKKNQLKHEAKIAITGSDPNQEG